MIDKAKICELLQSNFSEITAIYLFGSHATGTTGADSDLDLAVLLPHSLSESVGNLRCGRIQSDLEGALSMTVDLVNIRLASTVLQKEIIRAEHVLFYSNEVERIQFKMEVLSDYQRLNEERAEIIESFKEDGIAVAQ